MQQAEEPGECFACHTTGYNAVSGQFVMAGVTCVACHKMHTQKTRTAITTDALCAGCHQETTQDKVHQTHKQSDVRCVGYHLARPSGDIGGRVEGHAITGHSFTVTANTCTQCHDTQPEPSMPSPADPVKPVRP